MLAPQLVLATLQFGQLLFAAAVVLPMTGEYSADQTGSTLQAVPQRGVRLAAKSIVVVGRGVPRRGAGDRAGHHPNGDGS